MNYALIATATELAIRAHGNQKRKYTDEPYVLHCARVAHSVSLVQNVTAEMVAAAMLHDTLEDTDTKMEDLVARVGWETAQIVFQLTDKNTKALVPGMNRAQRKHQERLRYAQNSARQFEVHTIKTADCIDNAIDIMKHDPKFAVTYMDEMFQLMPYLTHADKGLTALLRNIVSPATRHASAP